MRAKLWVTRTQRRVGSPASEKRYLNVAKDTRVEQSEISKCVPWYLPNTQPQVYLPRKYARSRAHNCGMLMNVYTCRVDAKTRARRHQPRRVSNVGRRVSCLCRGLRVCPHCFVARRAICDNLHAFLTRLANPNNAGYKVGPPAKFWKASRAKLIAKIR